MRQAIRIIDLISEYTGRIAAWLTAILVWLVVVYVVMRYLFAEPLIWLQELHWHLFAMIFLLGAAYTLKSDAHVRVDVFYARFSSKRKSWVNLIGILMFLIPFCLIVITRSWGMVESAWQIREKSADPGGLPARYLIKAALPVGFSLLLIQGIGEALRSVLTLMGKEPQTTIAS